MRTASESRLERGPMPSATQNVMQSMLLAIALTGVGFVSWLWVGR